MAAHEPSRPSHARPDATAAILAAYGAAVLLFVIGAVVHPGFASFASITAILLVASFVGLVAAGQSLWCWSVASTSRCPGC